MDICTAVARSRRHRWHHHASAEIELQAGCLACIDRRIRGNWRAIVELGCPVAHEAVETVVTLKCRADRSAG